MYKTDTTCPAVRISAVQCSAGYKPDILCLQHGDILPAQGVLDEEGVKLLQLALSTVDTGQGEGEEVTRRS